MHPNLSSSTTVFHSTYFPKYAAPTRPIAVLYFQMQNCKQILLPHEALLARYWLRFCLCVCLSLARIILKRLDESISFLAYRLPST